MNLKKYKKKKDKFDVKIKKTLWYIVKVLFFTTKIPYPYSFKRLLLILFRARIGSNVIIKPDVNIKYPWKLRMGNDVWIGERAWIDNLDFVIIKNNVCISQGVYLCTGNHDYKKETFDLIKKTIIIEEGSWLCAFSRIAPGVTINRNSVIGFGAVVKEDTEENYIYSGNPAKKVRERTNSY